MLTQDEVVDAYRKIEREISADHIYEINNELRTVVELGFAVETCIGAYEIACVTKNETRAFSEWLEGWLKVRSLRECIVDEVIKKEYVYVSTGIVEMIVNKSRRSIECGSSWEQIKRFVRNTLNEREIERKE